MIEVRQTGAYAQWFDRLRDRKVRVRIDVRIGGCHLAIPVT